MVRFKHLYAVVLLVAIVLSGCGQKNYDRLIEDHKAMSLQEDGVWEIRYEKIRSDPSIDATTAIISINVKKDMIEDDMLEIMDYMELQYNADFDEAGVYQGKKEDAEFSCYAVFYRGDTDEEIKRIKYVNGKSVEITKEDDVYFASPEFRTEDDMDE